MAEMPAIDRDKCNGCGLCVTVCQCNVLVMIDNVVTIAEKRQCLTCNRWCAQCESVCPVGAITYPFEVVVEDR